MKSKNFSVLGLDKFIHQSLYDKKDGYYMSSNPFGKKGDFITSPNISIFFSEILAVWIVSFWETLKKPKKFNLIEIGAGNGEMINTILKTLKNFPSAEKACRIFILEKSPYLKKIQKKKIKNKNVVWINNLNKLKSSPCIFLANEFFDALPIKQFVKKKNLWFERKIKIYKGRNPEFIDIKVSIKKIEKLVGINVSKNQNFLEISKDMIDIFKLISKKIREYNGGLLIIDYGYSDIKMKNTLRGIKRHKIVNFISNYKKCDITHSLSFEFLKKIGLLNKLKVSGMTNQGSFLKKMGILERAEIVSKNLSFMEKSNIYYRLNKLVDKKFMGEVFKVLLLTNKKINFKLGFETD